MSCRLHMQRLRACSMGHMHATYRIRKEHRGPRRDKDENIGEFRNRDAAEHAMKWLVVREPGEFKFRVVTAIYFSNSARPL